MLNRLIKIVSLTAGVLSISRCAHPQPTPPVLTAARAKEEPEKKDGEKDYWDYLRCTSAELAIRWDMKPISQKSVEINYEVKNKSRANIHLLDRLLDPDGYEFTYKLVSREIIIQYAKEPGLIDLIRASIPPYGVNLRTPIHTYAASRMIKPGEVVEGRAILDIPLQSWHPARKKGSLFSEVRFVRLKLGYMIGDILRSMERRMDDGTVIQIPIVDLNQKQYFVCSSTLPW